MKMKNKNKYNLILLNFRPTESSENLNFSHIFNMNNEWTINIYDKEFLSKNL